MQRAKVLVVDLNNFSRYPTLSVGILAAVCRRADFLVRVFSPLAIGVRGVVRELRESPLRLLGDKLNFAAAQSPYRTVRAAREWVGENLRSGLSRNTGKVVAAFETEIRESSPQVVLVSAYLMYRELVEEIAAVCQSHDIALLVGGPSFTEREIIDDWVSIPGVTALAAGELELELPEIINRLIAKNDVRGFDGVFVCDPDGSVHGRVARPLRRIDAVPHADFSDFPWDRYPERIVPVLTGRGCGWGACAFCSDVTSTAGRTFRSRDPLRVLDEIHHHHESLGANLFVFTDMKLNSDLDMWHALITKMQDVAPGASWIASVHVGQRGDTGLSPTELRCAREAGCVRLSTGLESGSQRLLDEMKKGIQLEHVSQYLQAASAAEISTRATMISGYPGETADDVRASTQFVDDHSEAIERIKLCSFTLVLGTKIDRTLSEKRVSDAEQTGLSKLSDAKLDYWAAGMRSREYRRATARLTEAIHRVNKRPLPESAVVFEGVM